MVYGIVLQAVLSVLLCICAYFYLYSKLARPKGFPPGPFIFPLVGSLPFMRAKPFRKLSEWHQKYGDIIGFQMGVYRSVCIFKYDLFIKAFKHPALAGRPELDHFQYITSGKKRGITFNEGKQFQEIRPFVVNNLRELGFGKASLEDMLLSDTTDLIQHIIDVIIPQNKPVSTLTLFGIAVLRSLWNIATGEECAIAGTRMHEISAVFHWALEGTAHGGAAMLMPWYLKLLPNLSYWNAFKLSIDKVLGLLQDVVDTHKKNFKPNRPRDFTDVYLQEMKNTTDPSSAFYETTGYENLKCLLFNIFGAGTETTNGVLNWTVLYLTMYPEKQKRLHDEIDDVVGRTRLPNMKNKPDMPYTRAIIVEALRIASPVPMNLPRKATSDLEINGYFIPKGTLVFSNLHGMNHDKEIWGEDAHAFRPERHLDTKAPQPTIVFSSGERACPGRVLAEMNLFLFITCIFQRFTIQLDPATDMEKLREGLTEKTGVTRNPKAFQVYFKLRDED